MLRRFALTALMMCALAGCEVDATTSVDASDEEFPGDSDAAPAADSGGDGTDEECAPGVPGCTCTEVPQGNGCVHTFGGQYSDGACSGAYQCCDGAFVEGLDVCGACTCTEATGEVGCTVDEVECFPAFQGSSEPIPADVEAEMMGVSWHAELDCPSFDELRLLRLDHWGFDGAVHAGELVVAAAVADDMLAIFEKLYDMKFPIERMERIDVHGGDDDASMAANNTSAFNCRAVTGGTALSQHSFGAAIDINPVQNPYVRNDTVLPPAGAAYLDRSNRRTGMIVTGDGVVASFTGAGWGWGGTFSAPLKDYQHFSENGQ